MKDLTSRWKQRTAACAVMLAASLFAVAAAMAAPGAHGPNG